MSRTHWKALIKQVTAFATSNELLQPTEDEFIDLLEQKGFVLNFSPPGEDKDFCIRVLNYFNELKGGKPVRVEYPSVHAKKILALKKKGFTFEAISSVIDIKAREWRNTNMWKHFRPKTLFDAENFENYIAQDEATVTTDQEQTPPSTFDKFAAKVGNAQDRVSGTGLQ